MSQLDPIVNGASLYINGLIISNNGTTPHTKLDIAAGQARDSNNLVDMILGDYLNEGTGTANAATTLNFSVKGANGIDVGTIAATTWYYIFIIADSSNKNATATIASLSATAPTLPFGYDSIRCIGSVKTDGSAFLLKFYETNNNSTNRFFEWDAPIAVTVTDSGTSATYSAMDFSTGVPVSNYGKVTVYYIWDPNAAGDILDFTPAGATGDYLVNTAITTAIQDGTFSIKPLTVSSVPKVSYKISAGTLTGVKVMGYDMNL